MSYILFRANTVRTKKHAGFFYARTFRFPTPVQVLNGPAALNRCMTTGKRKPFLFLLLINHLNVIKNGNFKKHFCPRGR